MASSPPPPPSPPPYILVALLLVLLPHLFSPSSAAAPPRMLSLLKTKPPVLKYHKGLLLKGNVTVNLLWYGRFSPTQRSIVADFFLSLSSPAKSSPSVASWWSTTASYSGGPANIILGKQIVDSRYSLGKLLNNQHIVSLSSELTPSKTDDSDGAISFVLTSSDVGVEGFCMSRCGSHGWSATAPGGKGARFAYAWVGNSVTQCPGQCAWPFHRPIYGPQIPPLVAPNGDVGVDGMVISLATVLAGTVTNPFDKGYFQGPGDAPLEAVSACTGMFGKGAFPGYPGVVPVDKTTGASYNAIGWSGRKYLLPAMWDPKTSTCKTAV